MNNDKGKLYYGVGLDNNQLRADAAESRNIIKSIGDSSVSEGARIDSTFRKIGGTIAAVFTVQQAAAFAKSIVQVRGEMQGLALAFETLLGSKAKSDQMMNDVMQFALKTPYTISDVASNVKQLIAMGAAGDDVMETFKALGDVAAGLNVPISRIAINYGQVAALGKLQGREIRDFAMAGIPIVAELAKQFGVAEKEIMLMVEAGEIGFPAVQKAFEAMAGNGGQFENMMEKMNSTVSGQLSRLQDQIQQMLNKIGESNEGVIYGAIDAAATLVENYEEIGEALAVIIGIYGTYRAAIIATEAVRRSISTVQHTEEAAELYKLLTAEQQAMISKQGLSKTSAEYYALVKAETAANVQASQTTLAKARVEVKAASETVAARRAEYVAAKQLEEQRLAELMSIGATGSAKQVEAAQRKLSAAETQRESAAIAFQSATRDFNTKKTVVETAARTANTTSAAVNTAAETANATATGFLTVAKNRLAAAAARANAVIMANPYAIAAAAAIALGYGLYKLITYQTDAEKAQKKLNDAIKESDKSIAAEVHQLDSMFGRLKAAKQGTDEYRAAKEAIMNRYGGYLKKLGDEKTALNDIAAAYALIKDEAIKAARARAMETYTGEAAKDRADAEVKSLGKVEKLLNKKFKGQQGEDGISLSETYYWKIKPVIEGDAEITPEIEKIIKEFDKTKYVLGDPETDTESSTYVVNALRDEINAAAKARDIYNKSMNEARLKFGENPTTDDSGNKNTFDATTASLQQLMDRLPKAKEELAALKKAEQPDASAIAAKEKEIQQIKDQTTAREKSLTAIKDVKAQIKLLQDEQEKYGKDDAEYKALETRIKSLKTKLPATAGQSDKAESDEARLARETAERNQKIQEYSESVAKQVRQSELDIAQARIDAMDEGFDKEMAQNEQVYNRLIFANQQRESEMVKALQDARELEWENENPKAKDKGETFDRSTVTVADLSSEQRKALAEYVRIAEQYRLRSEDKLIKDLLEKYKSYEQQRTDINKKFDDERKAIENSNKTQEEKTAAIIVLEKARGEAVKAVNNEEVASMQKSSDLLVKLFSDASQRSVRELRTIISTTEELLTYLEKTGSADITPKFGFTAEELKTLKESPEKLKALREAIKELNGELGSRSPFEKFANDIKKAIDKIKTGDIEGGLEGIGSSIQAIMPTVKQFGEDLGTIFGDSQIGEDIGILTELIGGVGKGIQGIGQIASGDILGGITSLVSGIASIFSMANAAAERHREALQAIMEAKIAQQREYNLLLLQQNLLYEQGTTIFGNDSYGAAKNAVDNIKEAIRQLNQELAGTDAQRGKQQINALIKSIFGMNDANAALKQQYAGLADIKIVTGHKKTGMFGLGKGEDTYSSVLDVYPELIKANGEFDKSLAETIISTGKLDDSAKAALQNMIDLAEQYEQAMQEVKDYLTDIFGDLGNTMSNALADAFANGTDAADAFFDSVSDMLENLAKQMIYSVTIAPLMEKAQEQMLATMQNEGLTDEQKFNQYAQILANLTNDALAQQEYANDLYQQYQDMAAAKGIDIFGSDASREASQKGIATASQESVDENNGRLTAIQGHTYSLVEYSRLLVANSAMILDVVMGIKEDTKHLERLENIEDDMQSVKNTVNDIALKGIKLK